MRERAWRSAAQRRRRRHGGARRRCSCHALWKLCVAPEEGAVLTVPATSLRPIDRPQTCCRFDCRVGASILFGFGVLQRK